VKLAVYAVAGGRGVAAGTGLSRERLRAVCAGGVSAIAGVVRGPSRPTPANLVEYDRIIRRLSARNAALLPARFNTLVDDEDEVRLILRSRQASFRAALARVRGRVQMSIRLESTAPAAGPGRPATGADYLRQRAAANQVVEFAPLRSVVDRWVRDVRVERKGNVVTIYHLIPRASVTAYRRRLERAAAPGVLRVAGPFPPYAFAQEW
jgi:hypothetical protein